MDQPENPEDKQNPGSPELEFRLFSSIGAAIDGFARSFVPTPYLPLNWQARVYAHDQEIRAEGYRTPYETGIICGRVVQMAALWLVFTSSDYLTTQQLPSGK
jgi:hypothetical protein